MSFESVASVEEELFLRAQKRRRALITLGLILTVMTGAAAWQTKFPVKNSAKIAQKLQTVHVEVSSDVLQLGTMCPGIAADTVVVCVGECEVPGCVPNTVVCPLPNACVPSVTSNGLNCDSVCQSYNHNFRAVQTGTYVNGWDFDLCQANWGNEGFRGGYNLGNYGSCVVPHGGGEKGTSNFQCRCVHKDLTLMMKATHKKSCSQACPSGAALQTGTYYGHTPFYACAANYGGEGFRGGYQLGDTCVVGHGGGEKGSDHFNCVCQAVTRPFSR